MKNEVLGRFLTSGVAVTALSIFSFVLLWHLVTVVTEVQEYILPSPRAVGSTILDMRRELLDAALITLKEVLLGYLVSCIVAFPAGIAIAFSRITERLLYPLIVGSQAVPVVAVAPLFLVWFGFGLLPKVLIAALIAFFPIVIGTVTGLRTIDPAMLMMARASGASAPLIFWKIRLPTALPSVFGGLKLGISFAVIGAVVGEFVGGSEGLGYTIQRAQGNLQTDVVFATIVTLAGVSLSLFYVVQTVQRFVSYDA